MKGEPKLRDEQIKEEYTDLVRSNIINYIQTTLDFTAMYIILKSNYDVVTKAFIKSHFESEYKKLVTKLKKFELVANCDTSGLSQLLKDMKDDRIKTTIDTLKGVIV